MRWLRALFLLAALPIAAQAAPLPPADGRLRIVQFDFEGAGGTLFITPGGKTLMVDSGWPAGMGGPAPLPGAAPIAPSRSSAQRIADTLRENGLSRIDYLLTTHYHLDHVGGMPELTQLVPIGTFVDHGPNRETPPANATERQLAGAPVTLYARYEAAIGKAKRLILKPGDRIAIDGMTVTAANGDRTVVSRPLAGKGEPGTGCGIQPKPANLGGEENPRSLGFVASFGRARILLLGDTTQDEEYRLVCPRNLIGPIDLMIATHHGSSLSNPPMFAATVKPTVVIIPNGQSKGGDPSTYEAIAAAMPQGLWQVHEAVKDGARNTDAAHIANPAGVADASHPILATVAKDGTVTIANPRTGLSETYDRVQGPASRR